MPWAKFDERYPSHRKVRPLSDSAFRLDASAICWSAEHLTDGFIPEGDLPIVSDCKNPKKAATELVDRGRWEVTVGGWRIHDYLDYNPGSDEVKAQRERDAERKRRGRENRRSA